MDLLHAALVAAALLCSLSAGLVFAFAVVVMPGIRSLPDGDFLRAFQVMDRVIQENDPLFLLVWVGSVLTVVAALALAFGSLAGADRWLLLGAAVTYVVGVQVPTFAINVPLNNRLQALELDVLDQAPLRTARRVRGPMELVERAADRLRLPDRDRVADRLASHLTPPPDTAR
jgi:uncharacterized membrane protein